MQSLTGHISGILMDAFDRSGLPREYGRVTVSDRPDLAQFQCNGALVAAKAAKQNPRAIAERIVEAIAGNSIFRDLSIAGPGFINLSLTDAFLGEWVGRIALDPRLGVPEKSPETVVLDYGGPNIAKPMHVGHLRASIIGDAIRRLFAFAGDRAIGDVHMGDWGLPMGMLISEIEIRQPDLAYFDRNSAGPYPEQSPVTLAELEALYPQAAADCKADPERLERARLATAELQEGRAGYRALWQHFFDISVEAMKRDFAALGVHFDLWNGEACVDPLIAPMIGTMEKAGVVEHSEGALVVRVAEPDDKHEIPPLILRKSDGAVMYATTDLATIVDRVKSIDPDRMLYIVDQRQHLHFEQVFRAAIKAGLNGKAQLEHLGFGTMNGPDGKPFKTRTGGVMKLADLIRMTTEAAEARLAEAGIGKDYPADERAEIARMVGIAALKFADLSNHRIQNYVFDLDRFTRFEGKTGPYLLYAAVRVKSMLRKAEDQGDRPAAIVAPVEGERDLMLTLARLPEAIAGAYDGRAPNELCAFAYDLAQSFSGWYGNFHVLSEPDAEQRRGRLALADLALRQIVLVLGLLGIEVPERM
jgi:arginyl-tRNA synthetase